MSAPKCPTLPCFRVLMDGTSAPGVLPYHPHTAPCHEDGAFKATMAGSKLLCSLGGQRFDAYRDRVCFTFVLLFCMRAFSLKYIKSQFDEHFQSLAFAHGTVQRLALCESPKHHMPSCNDKLNLTLPGGIVRIVVRRPSLTPDSLSNHNLGTADVLALAKALRTNATLKKLK